MEEKDKLGAEFVNKEQLSFAKWIVGLSTAVISFSFAFLLPTFKNLDYKWIFIIGLIFLTLSVISGVRYVWVFLAALGYGSAVKYYEKMDLKDEKLIRRKEEYKRLKDRYSYYLSRYYYEALQVTFLLGLICLSIFTITNFIFQK